MLEIESATGLWRKGERGREAGGDVERKYSRGGRQREEQVSVKERKKYDKVRESGTQGGPMLCQYGRGNGSKKCQWEERGNEHVQIH